MRRKHHASSIALGFAISATSAVAAAQSPFRARVDAQISHPLSTPQTQEYGFGGGASASVEWAPTRVIGLFVRAQFLALAPEHGSLPQGVVAPDVGTLFAGSLGARVRPLPGLWGSAGDGPWVELLAGGGVTGGNVRPVGEVRLGASFGLGRFGVGPFVSYQRVFALHDDHVLPGDAELFSGGIEIALGPERAEPRVPPPPEPEHATPPPAPAQPLATAPRACPEGVTTVAADDDHDGCPDPDRDGDRVADAADQCPDTPEDSDNFQDSDGCPDPDNDQDSIADASDQCPNEAEVVNGVDDTDGCPDSAPVHLDHGRLVTDDSIEFSIDSVRLLPASQPILRAVARALVAHPEWRVIYVEGHADDVGPDQYNYDLSYHRASSVVEALWQYGVARRRLVPMGFGRSSPRADGRDGTARARNRRVEFVTDGHRSIGRARTAHGYVVIGSETRGHAHGVLR